MTCCNGSVWEFRKSQIFSILELYYISGRSNTMSGTLCHSPIEM